MACMLLVFQMGGAMDNSTIIHGIGIAEVLREKIQGALQKQAVPATEFAEFYLVSLLSDYHTSHQLPANESIGASEKPLALLFLEATNADPATKVRNLKKLGDTALVLSGFHVERIRRTLVDLSYYVSLGGTAYRHLARLHEGQQLFEALYHELSVNFEAFAEVIAAVAPWNQATTNADLVCLYKRWLATGDVKLEELLVEGGIPRSRLAPQKAS